MSMVKKIKRLLALSEDQSGKPEGELAAELAHKLMVKYAISRSDLSQAELDEDPFIYHRINLGARATWRRRLAYIICRHLGASGYYTRSSTQYTIACRQTQAEVVEYVVHACINQVEQGWANYKRRGGRGGRSNANAFKNEAVSSFRRVLRSQSQTGTGTALVVSAHRQADTWMKDNPSLNLTTTTNTWRGHQKAFDAGRRHGSTMSIRDGISGGRTRKLT